MRANVYATGFKSVTTFDRGYLGHDCRENERVIKLFFFSSNYSFPRPRTIHDNFIARKTALRSARLPILFLFYLLCCSFIDRRVITSLGLSIELSLILKNIAWKKSIELKRNVYVARRIILAANLSFQLFLTRYLFSYRWKNRSSG